jgi:DNA-binding response OmpR family regulator
MGTRESGKKTILLLDDEQIVRVTFRLILQSKGYSVLEADCYKTAVTVFESNREKVDLLIADISLPDGNGCELAMHLRNKKPDLRVLFISGHVGSEVCKYYGLDLTGLHFLRKPFRPDELVTRVHQVLTTAESFPRLHASKTRTA